MADPRREERLRNSVDLVSRIVDQVCANHLQIENHGLKDSNPAYEVWVKYNDKIITLHSFSSLEIESCTDPDGQTAIKRREYIRSVIRQKLEVLLTA